MSTVILTEEHRLEPIDEHLIRMRHAIAEIDDPAEKLFFSAHLEGMEQLAKLQKRWQKAKPDERETLAGQIAALRTKLTESLEALKPQSLAGGITGMPGAPG